MINTDTRNLLQFDVKNVVELQSLYSHCEKAEEFFQSIGGQILIEKLIISREDLIENLITCKPEELIQLQAEIKAIESVSRFIYEYKLDKEEIREEIENRKNSN